MATLEYGKYLDIYGLFFRPDKYHVAPQIALNPSRPQTLFDFFSLSVLRKRRAVENRPYAKMAAFKVIPLK